MRAPGGRSSLARRPPTGNGRVVVGVRLARLARRLPERREIVVAVVVARHRRGIDDANGQRRATSSGAWAARVDGSWVSMSCGFWCLAEHRSHRRVVVFAGVAESSARRSLVPSSPAPSLPRRARAMRRELTTRAGAAAMARAEGRDGARLPASDDDIAHETSPGKVTSSSSSRPGRRSRPPRADAARAHASAPSDGLVLPDEVVMRILRHVLEDGRAGDARAVGAWAGVFARARAIRGADDAPPVPPPARLSARCASSGAAFSTPRAPTSRRAARSCSATTSSSASRASSAGRARDSPSRDPTSSAAEEHSPPSDSGTWPRRLPALVVLDVRRTGMELAEIFHVASASGEPRAREVHESSARGRVATRTRTVSTPTKKASACGPEASTPSVSTPQASTPSVSTPLTPSSPPSASPPSRTRLPPTASLFSLPSSSSLGPWESAVPHDVPSGGAALSELARLLRAGPPGLEELSLAHLPNLWRRPKASRADEEETSAAAGRRAGACAALAERTSLRALRLRDVGLDDAAAADVVRSLPSTLEELRMEGEGVGARATGEIARAGGGGRRAGFVVRRDAAEGRRRASRHGTRRRDGEETRERTRALRQAGGRRSRRLVLRGRREEIKRGVGFDQSSAGTGAAGTETGTATLARRFLARWTRRRGASRSKRVEDDGELRLSADAPADPNEEEMDDDDEEIDEEIEDALRRWTPRAVARDVLSHLARREAFHDDDDDDVETNETTWKTTSRRDGDAARTRTMTPSPSRPMTPSPSRPMTSPRTSPSPSSLSSAAEAWSVAGPGASRGGARRRGGVVRARPPGRFTPRRRLARRRARCFFSPRASTGRRLPGRRGFGGIRTRDRTRVFDRSRDRTRVRARRLVRRAPRENARRAIRRESVWRRRRRFVALAAEFVVSPPTTPPTPPPTPPQTPRRSRARSPAPRFPSRSPPRARTSPPRCWNWCTRNSARDSSPRTSFDASLDRDVSRAVGPVRVSDPRE